MATNIFDDVKSRLTAIEVLNHFGHQYRHEGRNRLLIRCPTPGHEDKTPSCHVQLSNPDTWICRACKAGGTVVDLYCALSGQTIGHEVALQMASLAGIDVDRYEKKEVAGEPQLVAEYCYQDASGATALVVERWEPGRPDKSGAQKKKSFRQRWSTSSKMPLLYQLPLCIDAAASGERIYLVEGEKCADAMRELGLLATTWHGNKPEQSVSSCGGLLRGAQIVGFPDNDKPGLEAMRKAADTFKRLGVDVTISHVPSLLSGQDIADAIAAGATREDVEDWADAALQISTEEIAWQDQLDVTDKGVIVGHEGNAAMILENEPAAAGCLRFNCVGNVVEVVRRPPWRVAQGERYPRPFSDVDVVAISQWLSQHHSYKCRVGVNKAFQAAFLVANMGRVDPVRDMLLSDEWDGASRLSLAAEKIFRCNTERDVATLSDGRYLFSVLVRKWLIAGAARGLDPGTKCDTILVLEGPQGAKKSTALAILGGEYYSDQVKDIGSKDTSLLLVQTHVLEIPELDALERKEVNAIKAWASANSDDFRPPYGKAIIHCPRRTISAATTNEQIYLRDPTGDRRFWPLPCGDKVDVELLRVWRQQLWAEAVHAYRAGEQHWLMPEEEDCLTRVQEIRSIQDPWFERIASDAVGKREMRVSEALRAVGKPLEKATQADSRRITTILRQLGFTTVSFEHEGSGAARGEKRKTTRVYCRPEISAQKGKGGTK